MEIELNNNKYPVEIIKKKNKNTYIRVKNGRIIATTNKYTSDKMIYKIIMDNKKSIISMIEKDQKKNLKNEEFYLFGNKINVIYGFNETEITDNKLFIKDEKELTKYLDAIIKDKFSKRLIFWYNSFEEHIPMPSLLIRKMTSRWGVCNTKSNKVTLNYNLYKYDETCLDYVIVHELSHFIHPNHSKNFWYVVSKYYPNYKEARKLLRE